jgi:hypothetical protein
MLSAFEQDDEGGAVSSMSSVAGFRLAYNNNNLFKHVQFSE